MKIAAKSFAAAYIFALLSGLPVCTLVQLIQSKIQPRAQPAQKIFVNKNKSRNRPLKLIQKMARSPFFLFAGNTQTILRRKLQAAVPTSILPFFNTTSVQCSRMSLFTAQCKQKKCPDCNFSLDNLRKHTQSLVRLTALSVHGCRIKISFCVYFFVRILFNLFCPKYISNFFVKIDTDCFSF